MWALSQVAPPAEGQLGVPPESIAIEPDGRVVPRPAPSPAAPTDADGAG